jgi:hypothetical protein
MDCGEHQLVACRAARLLQPTRHLAAQVGERDAGTVRRGRVGGGMVRCGHDPHTPAARREGPRRAGGVPVAPGSDRRDARRGQVLERVVERVGSEVEHVVVCERDARHAHLGQAHGRDRWGAEEERLAGEVDRRPALGDATLEVEHEEVGAARRVGQRRVQQRDPRVTREPLADAAAEHRVAGERERHHMTDRTPTPPRALG